MNTMNQKSRIESRALLLLWLILLFSNCNNKLFAQEEDDPNYWIAVGLTALSLVTPSVCNIQYVDENEENANLTKLGCGLDLEAMGGRVVAIGVETKLKCAKYAGFAPENGGIYSIKANLGLGIPTKSERFGGLYVGGSFGGGYVDIYDYYMLGYSYGWWAFAGIDKIGLKVAWDKFVNNEDPDGYSFQGKLYIGRYLTIGIDRLKTVMNDHPEKMMFINLGICVRD